ncbi:MAG: selenoneine biosynthesis selenosugar synthase SenB [Nannocystaceae bacterium]
MRSLSIGIVTPTTARSRQGNGYTASRWARMLRELGQRVMIGTDYDGVSRRGAPDLLIVLHARRSAPHARAFLDAHPSRPLVVVLTGTDLYRDLPDNRAARTTLDQASAVVALQSAALDRLGPWRDKVHVIVQSVTTPTSMPTPRTRTVDACVVGHLRTVKDPLRPAIAARGLPACSRIAVLQVGRALEATWRDRALAEMERNRRYHWLGEQPRWKARQLIARSRMMILPSLMEGGAHVVAEAVVAGTPVLATRIDGTVGQLGEGYPGYFEVEDTAALTELMGRVEMDARFVRELERWGRRCAPAFAPQRELAGLRRLLRAL